MSQEGYPHYNQNFNACVEQNMGYRDFRSNKSANRKKTKPNPKRPDKTKAEEEPSRSTAKVHKHVHRPLTFKVVSMRLQGTLHNNTLKVTQQ
jgi:hypothetical protein